MDASEKVARKIRRGVLRIAEECSRVFKTDVSIQPGNGEMPNGSWLLGIVGIGTLQLTPDATVATSETIMHKRKPRKQRRGKRSADGKRSGRSSGSVGSTGSQADSN